MPSTRFPCGRKVSRGDALCPEQGRADESTAVSAVSGQAGSAGGASLCDTAAGELDPRPGAAHPDPARGHGSSCLQAHAHAAQLPDGANYDVEIHSLATGFIDQSASWPTREVSPARSSTGCSVQVAIEPTRSEQAMRMENLAEQSVLVPARVAPMPTSFWPSGGPTRVR